jgi:hypothetical protein
VTGNGKGICLPGRCVIQGVLGFEMGQIVDRFFIYPFNLRSGGSGGRRPAEWSGGLGRGGSPPRKERGRAFKQTSSSTLGIQKHGVFGGAPVGKPWFSDFSVTFMIFSFS